mgnify:CR=1 FL=1
MKGCVMQDECLCENIVQEINDLFFGDRHFSAGNISEKLYLLFRNREFDCIEKIVKVLPDNIIQSAVVQDLLTGIKYYDEEHGEENILFFYKNTSYYRLKISISYVLGWKYIDYFDLESARIIQIETLQFIKEDCPLLYEYYLYSVIYMYVSSKVNDGYEEVDYDFYIQLFNNMITNKKIINHINLLIADFDKNCMNVFDSEDMIFGHEVDGLIELITPFFYDRLIQFQTLHESPDSEEPEDLANIQLSSLQEKDTWEFIFD